MRLHPAIRFATSRAEALSEDVLPEHPDDDSNSEYRVDDVLE